MRHTIAWYCGASLLAPLLITYYVIAYSIILIISVHLVILLPNILLLSSLVLQKWPCRIMQLEFMIINNHQLAIFMLKIKVNKLLISIKIKKHIIKREKN